MALRLARKILDLFYHAWGKSLIVVVEKFDLLKFLGVFTFGKISEEEREFRNSEKAVLRGSAVLVHGLAHDWEVNRSVLEVDVGLMMTVAKHKHLQHFEILVAYLRANATQQIHKTRLVLLWELFDDLEDALVLLQAFTLVEERFEDRVIVVSHCSEASSFEVEVKFHILFCFAGSLRLGYQRSPFCYINRFFRRLTTNLLFVSCFLILRSLLLFNRLLLLDCLFDFRDFLVRIWVNKKFGFYCPARKTSCLRFFAGCGFLWFVSKAVTCVVFRVIRWLTAFLNTGKHWRFHLVNLFFCCLKLNRRNALRRN